MTKKTPRARVPARPRRAAFTIYLATNSDELHVDLTLHSDELAMSDLVPVVIEYLAARQRDSATIRQLAADLRQSTDPLADALAQADQPTADRK